MEALPRCRGNAQRPSPKRAPDQHDHVKLDVLPHTGRRVCQGGNFLLRVHEVNGATGRGTRLLAPLDECIDPCIVVVWKGRRTDSRGVQVAVGTGVTTRQGPEEDQ